MKHLLIALTILLLPAWAAAQDWPEVARDVKAQEPLAQAQAGETRSLLAQDKAAVDKDMAALQASIASKQQAFDALKARYDELMEQEDALNEELAQQAHEIKTIDGTIRTSAKQARDYFHESLTTPEFPDRAATLDRILTPDRFPGLGGIQSLLALYLGEMKASGEVVRWQGSFTGTNGKEARGQVVRVGAFTAAYRTASGDMGFLRPGENGGGLVAVQGEPGWKLAGIMNDYFDGSDVAFPMDISNGAALLRLAQEQKSVMEWLSAGGLLVWPIILVGVVALALVAERFYALSRIRGNSDHNMEAILGMVSLGQWKACGRFCTERPNFPTCRIIGHTLKHLGSTREIIENAFQEGLLKEIPALERFLPTLVVLAAVAPLLGLLGTVTGMINTFQVITLYGTGDPRMMSGGISEALVTTQLGLAVAVPIMLLHHILDRRVDKIVGDMEEKGTSFAVALMKKSALAAKETARAAS